MRFLAWLLSVVFGASKKPPSEPAIADPDYLFLVNGFNAIRDKPLKWSDELAVVAADQVGTMAHTETLEHAPDLFGRVALADTTFSVHAVGENIAIGRTASAVLDGWKSSSGHHRNIVDRRFSHVGVARALSARGSLYWAAVYAG